MPVRSITRDPSAWVSEVQSGAFAHWQNTGAGLGTPFTNDGLGVKADIGQAQPSHWLKVTGFGAAVPTGAKVLGIEVEVNRWATLFTDYAARIVKGGVIGASDRSSAAQWPTADDNTYFKYGSPTDLWGETWMPADTNSSGFGFALSAQRFSGALDQDGRVDHIRTTVYYLSGGPRMML